MEPRLSRRRFLRKSFAASSAAALGFGFEEQALRAQAAGFGTPQALTTPPGQTLPMGKIGNLTISRLICGGNLIAGFAHSRDLIYVSTLLKHYFTDAKVIETLERCEAAGINTAILRLDDDTLRILKAYWKEPRHKMQWIAQIEISESDMATQIQHAADHGAVGAFTHGGIGDDLVKRQRVDVLARAVELIRKHRIIAGVAGHALEVVTTCERAGVNPDFYMKTFNSKAYWSAGPVERHDSVWAETPDKTKAFMENIDRPWIAYKVLGAGAIHPREGFRYAFRHGADFLCVGMFDFQIEEDAALANLAFDREKARNRAWCG